jgi:hypothetical protein
MFYFICILGKKKTAKEMELNLYFCIANQNNIIMKINRKAFTLWSMAILALFIFASCGGQQESTTSEDMEEAMEETMEQADDNESLPSPRRQATGQVGGVAVTVDYGSPAVRGRVIFGDLEPWGEVWRAGANASTSIEFTADVVMGGTDVAAGKYAIFMIPNEDGNWTLILNSDYEQWGAYAYDAGKDVARWTVSPEWSDNMQERLMYAVEDGMLKFAWEKARLNVPLAAK